MGVRGLNKYIKENIRPNYKYWQLNKTKYKSLIIEKNDVVENKLSNTVKNKNSSINLVIDGYSYFYYLADELNWFIYDNINLINLLTKVLYI